MRIFTRQNLLPLLAGLGLFLNSCSGEKEKAEPIDAEGFRIYTIKAGEHDCDNEYKQVTTSAMHFSVIFDSSAVYQTIDPVNQYDINKLYGLADCNTAHHSNSARMGWRWVNNQLEIHAYVYKNGKRNEDLITAVPIGQPVKMSIEMLDSTYIFKVGDKFTELARGCSGQGTGYKLYPYFGGDETAPHEIKVKVKDL
ncbi:hypothetical protein [Adhaeribacter soli]|uniref:Uncharacterized protein n=1 Tax=Adhaeribacter soli TaxID=2607655 RepID=A0A5N1JB59_9BACT|nr:hypothetical protein [Adhaeribacter soli]KAA9346099.1 hypothetical protein F0P94_03185 [Adhaeribacter soli]